MDISLVQSRPKRAEIKANLDNMDRLLGNGNGSDVYVFHEMFAQGQYIDPEPVAQTMDGEIVSWMREKSRLLDAALVGSVAIKEDGVYRNRQIMAMPDGSLEYYDKHHLFGYSGEADFFEAGQRRVIVEFRGVRFFLQICYDLRFPIFCRNMNDYDVAIYSAFWPIKRQLAWDTLLRARAIENQVFVVGVNPIGSDQYGQYNGHSCLIGPYGEALASAPDNWECVTKAYIDMELLTRYRSKFPVLKDADFLCQL